MPLLSVDEYRAPAQSRLPADVWGYLAGGSGTESLLGAAREALDRLRLRPSALVDVSRCDPTTTLLGAALDSPLGVAPVAYHRLCHPDGEVATARAAGERGVLFIASMFASRTLEEIAGAGAGPRWMQLYWLRDRRLLLEVVGRAEAAGFGALVLTVDAPRIARRPRDLRNGFTLPPDVHAANLPTELMSATHRSVAGTSAIARLFEEQFDASVTWADLAWLRERTRLPLVLKGILTADDAERALAHGVAGVVVSNHGGRQLDHAIPSADALPAVVDAVAGRCPVLVDGGIRSGVDVLRVLALGADAALVGRPAMWGLAVGGCEGVREVLALLQEELVEAMQLAGRPTLKAVDRTLLDRR